MIEYDVKRNVTAENQNKWKEMRRTDGVCWLDGRWRSHEHVTRTKSVNMCCILIRLSWCNRCDRGEETKRFPLPVVYLRYKLPLS